MLRLIPQRRPMAGAFIALRGWVAMSHFTIHHQSVKAIDVVTIEIPTDVAISFAHSNLDTVAISSRPLPHCIIC